MRAARGLAVLSVASVAVLGLSACSDDDAPKASTTVAADASTQATTDATEPASDDATDEPAQTEAPAPGDLTPENFASRLMAASTAAGSTTMSMSTGAAGVSIDMTADITFLGTTQNMSMLMSTTGMDDMEIRIVDELIYVNLGSQTGGKFLKIDPTDESDPMAAGFDGILDQMDPNASVEGLEDAITSLTKVGEPVDLDGVQAQQYEVVVDTSLLTGAAKEQLAQAGNAIPRTLTYMYWIDADDLMHKVTISVAGQDLDMTFTNWGTSFDTVAPGEDEIFTMP